MTKQRCVYCGGQAITRDHVPPRCLLERPYPPNLPTVPNCSSCNAGFSLDEQYFVVLLTQVGVAPTLFRKQGPEGSITRALQRAPGLDRRIFNALASDEETGAIVIRPELRRVRRVIQKIGLGLFVLRYNRVPRPGELARVTAHPYAVHDDRPTPLFISTFTESFKRKQWRHIQKGVFSYIIVRDPTHGNKVWCVMDFHQSLWGVVHFPNPRARGPREDDQLWLCDHAL